METGPPFDSWASANGWLQRHGHLGFAILVVLVSVGWVLDKSEGLEALLHLLSRDRKPPDPPPTPRSQTHGLNSPVITGGSLSAEGDLVIGEKHEHHTHLPPPTKPELPKTHTPHNRPDHSTSYDRFVGRAAELQHQWRCCMVAVEAELSSEPKGVEVSHKEVTHRLEAVGLVYLWPISGLPWGGL